MLTVSQVHAAVLAYCVGNVIEYNGYCILLHVDFEHHFKITHYNIGVIPTKTFHMFTLIFTITYPTKYKNVIIKYGC